MKDECTSSRKQTRSGGPESAAASPTPAAPARTPRRRTVLWAAAMLVTVCVILVGIALANRAAPATSGSRDTTAENASAALTDGPQAQVVPAGYNEHDYNKLADFLDQTDDKGISNGKKLDSRYDGRDITDAAKALGAVWDAADGGEQRLVSLKYYGKNTYVMEIPSAPLLAGTLDLSGCTALRELELSYDFSGLRIDGCTALERIASIYAPMEALAVLDCPALEEVRIEFSGLRSFRMEGCPAVQKVLLVQSPVSDFQVRGAEALRWLYLNDNQLTELDLSGMPALEELSIQRNPLQALDLSPCGALTRLYCSSLGITALDLTPFPKLQRLILHDDSALTQLDLSENGDLIWLELHDCPVTELDLSACRGLTRLEVVGTEITELDLSARKELHVLRLRGNPLRSVDLTGCDQLGFYGIRAEGDGAVDLTLSFSQGRTGPQRAAVSAGARPGEGMVFLSWQDRSGKPLYAALRDKEQINIESGGSYDGLVAVFGP